MAQIIMIICHMVEIVAVQVCIMVLLGMIYLDMGGMTAGV